MKCLILTVTIGNGHNAVANAMAEELSSRGHEVKVIDLYKNHKFISYVISDLGFAMGFRFPNLANNIFMQAKKQGKTPFTRFNKSIKKELLAQINEFEPDIIVSSHVAGRLFVREYGHLFKKPVKSVFFVTDFDVPPSLDKTFKDDYVIIPSPVFREELLANGFKDDHIKTCGIPLNKSFYEPILRKDARKRLEFSLDSKKLTILMLGGMKGVGNLFNTLKRISSEPNFQIIFLSSKNTKLKAKVEKFIKKRKPAATIISEGFVKSISDVMACSDLMIGKAGCLTCTEAIERGVPMFLYSNVCYPERQNTEFLVSKKCAIALHPRDNYIEVIKNANLTEMEKNLTKLKMVNPAVTAADFIESIGGVAKKEPSTDAPITSTDISDSNDPSAPATSPKSEPIEQSAPESKANSLDPSAPEKSNLSEPSATEQTSNLNEQSNPATDENNNQPKPTKQEAVNTSISQSEVAWLLNTKTVS